MAEKLDIVSQLRRVVDRAQNGMPPTSVGMLLEAADEIVRLRGQIGGFTLCRNDHPEALAISRFGEHHGYVRPYS